MTSWSHSLERMFESQPDFRRVVASFEELTAEWQRKAAELNAAMTAGAGEEDHEHFTLRTVGLGQISQLTFKDGANDASPVQLRTAVLEAYARLAVGANGVQASTMARILDDPAIATGMTAAVPREMRDRAGQDAATPDADAPGVGTRPVDSATAEEVLAWAEATAEPTIVSADMRETMSDVEGWSPRYQGIDPNTTQYELEKEIEQISRNAAELRPALERLQVQKSSKWLTLTVNGSGVLADITFRPAFRSAGHQQLSKDFAALYAEATHEASAQLMAQLGAAGLGGADDPTADMLRRFDAASDELLSRFDRL